MKAVILAPYCTGALTLSGNSARVFAPQAVHSQSCARCSVTNERLRLGQIKHLTGAMANARFRVEAHAAHRTGRRIMIDDFVGISDLSQGLAFVTLLPTRFLAGPFTQTRHPRRLLQPIARRRLPLFELFNPSRRSSSAIWALSAATSAMS